MKSKFNTKCVKPVLKGLLLVGLLAQPKLQADLVLALSGSAGSATVNYTASGSVTITQAVGALNLEGSARAQGVTTDGSWADGFDDNVGDLFAISDQADISLSDDVSYRKNGVEFGVMDLIILNNSGSAGNDEVELKSSVGVPYPSLVADDIVSWAGSGTFTLQSGTYDTVFTNPGSFSNAIDGGNFTLTVTAVPEPHEYGILVGLGLLGFVVVRNRVQRTQTA